MENKYSGNLTGELLLINESKLIAGRDNTTEANLHRWLKKHSIK